MAVSVDDAKRLLGPHLSTLKSCVDAGIEKFNVDHGSNRHYLSPHSRANIIRDLIIYHVRIAFESKDGVTIMERGRLFLLNIGGEVLLRFKKMNERMLTSNIPTQQAQNFSRQQLSFGFLHPLTSINVGYIPNDVYTRPQRVIIACPSDMSSNHWYMDITEEGGVQVAPVHPIAKPVDVDKQRLVRAKVPAKTRKTGTSDVE